MNRNILRHHVVKLCLCMGIATALMTSCSRDSNTGAFEGKTQIIATNKPVTIKLTVEPRLTKDIKGDFTQSVPYSIQERSWHKLLDGQLKCNLMPDSRLKCETTDSLNTLIEGKTYRILVFNQRVIANHAKENDEIGCDYFIYDKSRVPNMAITAKTSGECLLWQLNHDTGFGEEEIRRRVYNVLNDSSLGDHFDLPLELYNLYKTYDTEHDWQRALFEITKIIKENKPLPSTRKPRLIDGGRLI